MPSFVTPFLASADGDIRRTPTLLIFEVFSFATIEITTAIADKAVTSQKGR